MSAPLTSEQQQTVLDNYRLVYWAERYFGELRRRVLRTVPAERVEVAGEDALLEAVRRYDPARGLKLSGYFARLYRSHLLRLLEREAWPVRYWKGPGEVYRVDLDNLPAADDRAADHLEAQDELDRVRPHLSERDVMYMTGTAAEAVKRSGTSHQNVYTRRAVVQRRMRKQFPEMRGRDRGQ